MSNSNILRAFLNHFDEYIEDILRVYPDNTKFLKCKLYFEGIKKTNPRLIIQTWKSMVVDVYREKIEAGDVTFFITKDYSVDTNGISNADAVSKGIEEIRTTIQTLGPENINMAMKYVQNLTKLCDLYYPK